MAYCPNCANEVALDAIACSKCGARFDGLTGWRPAMEPALASNPTGTSKISRGAVIVITLLLVPFLGVIIMPGVFIYYGTRAIDAGLWRAVAAVAGFGVLWLLGTFVWIAAGFGMCAAGCPPGSEILWPASHIAFCAGIFYGTRRWYLSLAQAKRV